MLDYRSVIINGLPSQPPPPCKTFTQGPLLLSILHLLLSLPQISKKVERIFKHVRSHTNLFHHSRNIRVVFKDSGTAGGIGAKYRLLQQKQSQQIKQSFLNRTEMPVWSQKKHTKTTTDFSPRRDLKILKSFQQGDTSGLNMRASRTSIPQLVIII